MQKFGPPNSQECSCNNGFAVPGHVIQSEGLNGSALYKVFLDTPW